MNANEIRAKFLDFFQQKAHQIVPSAPIVLKNDPTLMFTNAGMNQFKDIFLGNESALHPRVADTQKCLRVSGKHNDLEEVGKDTYHHTMFEMLGNWSFGDYFKKEAIQWAWELMVEVYGLNPERLYVTVFAGDEQDGLPEDKTAFDLWSAIVPKERILFFGKKDNFWEMGAAGPCGPASEIHYDMRPQSDIDQKPGKALVNQDHPQVIELWNLVFMEFNRFVDGSLKPLPSKHVDTGMGLERLVAVLQGKSSNYDTDLFQPLIQKVAQKFKVQYGQSKEVDVALRVIADHSRTLCFSIADGQMPSNNGAGYVIRRILRRAVRYAYRYLNAEQPFLYDLVPLIAVQFEGVFPEVQKQQELIAKVVEQEELAFLKTLADGSALFEQLLQKYQKTKQIPGQEAFTLYDTFGFPFDLTALMAKEAGFEVDVKGFEEGLAAQKNRSKKDAVKTSEDWVVLHEEAAGKPTKFVGYDHLSVKAAKLLRYRKVSQKGKVAYQLVFNTTPFYPEGGGQVGDTGWIMADGGKVAIENTVKENNLIIHLSRTLPESPETLVELQVNEARRKQVAAHHSATHLMHAALKEILGDHVQQKGSLVSPTYLRFDFTHFEKVSTEKLNEVEKLINEKIRENIPLLEERKVKAEEAIARGATALFGEKYGDYVRVISFNPEFSMELCGGTHVNATGTLGFFKFTAESAVAAGIRRVEAVVGDAAFDYLQQQLSLLDEMRLKLKNPKKPLQAIGQMQSDKKALEKELTQLKAKQAAQVKKDLSNAWQDLANDAVALVEILPDTDAGTAKDLLFQMRSAAKKPFFILLINTDGNKLNLWLAIDPSLVERYGWNAGKLIKDWSKKLKGGGGGGADFASAGGKEVAKVPEVLAEVKAFLKTTTLDESPA